MTDEFKVWVVQMALEGKLPYGTRCPWGSHRAEIHDEPSCRVFRSDIHRGGYFVPCNRHLQNVLADRGISGEVKIATA